LAQGGQSQPPRLSGASATEEVTPMTAQKVEGLIPAINIRKTA
jgi:hypothetical protein